LSSRAKNWFLNWLLLTLTDGTRVGIALHGDYAELALLVGGIDRNMVYSIGGDEPKLAHDNAAFICGSGNEMRFGQADFVFILNMNANFTPICDF